MPAPSALPLEGDVKQQLLAECRVRRRAEILLAEVEKLAVAKKSPARARFPPTFSENSLVARRVPHRPKMGRLYSPAILAGKLSGSATRKCLSAAKTCYRTR